MSSQCHFSIASIRRENMLGYLCVDIICSGKRTVFRERSSRKTVSFPEQIMSADKCPSILSKSNAYGGYWVYYPSNNFRNTRSFENWGIFSDILQFKVGNIRSPDAFRPIVRERRCLMDYLTLNDWFRGEQ